MSKKERTACPECHLPSVQLGPNDYCEHCGHFNRAEWKKKNKANRIGLGWGTLLFGFLACMLLLGANSLFDLVDRLEKWLPRLNPSWDSENHAWFALLVAGVAIGLLFTILLELWNMRGDEALKSASRSKKARARWESNRASVIGDALSPNSSPQLRIGALRYVKDDKPRLRELLARKGPTQFRTAIVLLLKEDAELMAKIALDDEDEAVRLAALPFMPTAALVEAMSRETSAPIEKALLSRSKELLDRIVPLMDSPIREPYKLDLIAKTESLDTLADLKAAVKEPTILKALDARIVELRDAYIDTLWGDADREGFTTATILKLIEGERLRAVQKGIIARVTSEDILKELSSRDIDPILKKTAEERMTKLAEEAKKAAKRKLARQVEEREQAAERARMKKAEAERIASMKTPGVVIYSPGYSCMPDSEAVAAIMMFALQSGNPHLMLDSVPKLSLPLFGELSGETIIQSAYKDLVIRKSWRPISPQIQFAFKQGVAQYAIAFPSIADVLGPNAAQEQVTQAEQERFSNADADTLKDLLANLGEKAKKRSVTGVWSWTDSRSGQVKYVVFHSTAESNEFEFEAPDYVTEKVQFWERGSFSVAGRTFVDGPDWAEKDQKKLEDERGGAPEQQLFEAIEAADAEAVKAILAKGASPNAKGGTWSRPALLEAGQKNQLAIVEALLGAGANANATSSSGWPVLAELISATCDFDIVKALVEAGSDVNMKAPTGVTPLRIAEARGSQDVIALLRAHGAN